MRYNIYIINWEELIMTLNKVYEKLLTVVDEDKMSKNGVYLSYFKNADELADQYGLKNNKIEFEKVIQDKFNLDLCDLDADFITLDESAATGGDVYTDPANTFDDVIHDLIKEPSLKKYVKKNKIKEVELNELLTENNKEINYDLVNIEFTKLDIELTDAVDEDDPRFLIGVEGENFSSAIDAFIFLKNNGLLI